MNAKDKARYELLYGHPGGLDWPHKLAMMRHLDLWMLVGGDRDGGYTQQRDGQAPDIIAFHCRSRGGFEHYQKNETDRTYTKM